MGALLCLVALIASAVVLLRAIRAFRADWRSAEITRVPAVPMQSMHIPEAGPIELFLEGPRYVTRRKRLHYALKDPETAQPLPVRPVLMGSYVSGTRRVRAQRGRFVLPRPGAFELHIDGLQPDDAREYAIVLMRPIAGKVIRFALTCVLLGTVLIGSLVLGIFLLVL